MKVIATVEVFELLRDRVLRDAGGSGNFANEPSPNTIMFFLDADSGVMNMAAGFTGGFSFFYTSSTAASVNVYDGLNATGSLLGAISLAAQYNSGGCAGDPNGGFCNWSAGGVSFGGTAMSIDFGGTANQTGYDNITFGSATPVGVVPEPETYAMLLAGLGLWGFARRRLVCGDGAGEAELTDKHLMAFSVRRL